MRDAGRPVIVLLGWALLALAPAVGWAEPAVTSVSESRVRLDAGGKPVTVTLQGTDLDRLQSAAVLLGTQPAAGVAAQLGPPSAKTSRAVTLTAQPTAKAGRDYRLQVAGGKQPITPALTIELASPAPPAPAPAASGPSPAPKPAAPSTAAATSPTPAAPKPAVAPAATPPPSTPPLAKPASTTSPTAGSAPSLPAAPIAPKPAAPAPPTPLVKPATPPASPPAPAASTATSGGAPASTPGLVAKPLAPSASPGPAAPQPAPGAGTSAPVTQAAPAAPLVARSLPQALLSTALTPTIAAVTPLSVRLQPGGAETTLVLSGRALDRLQAVVTLQGGLPALGVVARLGPPAPASRLVMLSAQPLTRPGADYRLEARATTRAIPLNVTVEVAGVALAYPALSRVERTSEGYTLVGRGFGVDRGRVQVFEGNALIGTLVSVADTRIVVRSQPTGLVQHRVVVGGLSSGTVASQHPAAPVVGSVGVSQTELARILQVSAARGISTAVPPSPTAAGTPALPATRLAGPGSSPAIPGSTVPAAVAGSAAPAGPGARAVTPTPGRSPVAAPSAARASGAPGVATGPPGATTGTPGATSGAGVPKTSTTAELSMTGLGERAEIGQ